MKNIAITKQIQDTLTPKDVLHDLLDGNKRFIDAKSQDVDNSALVQQTTGGQFPKAVVLSCIDSRVPVETVLDQAIGDIFVARVAGNFENADILGSLEYSCKVAGSKLVLVLGHEACGAVKAACDGVELGNITHLLSNILPAVDQSKIREKSPILKEMEDAGEIQIVGGVYSLHSGKVEML